MDSKSDFTDTSSVNLISVFKSEKVSGIIITELGDVPLRVIEEACNDSACMLKMLDRWYTSNTTVSHIAVQAQLFHMSYNGQNMASYIEKYTSSFNQLDRQ